MLVELNPELSSLKVSLRVNDFVIFNILGESQHFYCQAKNGVYIDMLKCLGLEAKVGDILLLAGQLLPGAWEFSKC